MASDEYFVSLGDTLVRENFGRIEFALAYSWGSQEGEPGKHQAQAKPAVKRPAKRKKS